MAVGTTENSCIDPSAGIRNNTKIGGHLLKAALRDTSLSKRPNFLILPKQLHQVRTNYSNVLAHGGHIPSKQKVLRSTFGAR